MPGRLSGLFDRQAPVAQKLVQDIKTHWLEKVPDAVKAMKAAKLAGAPAEGEAAAPAAEEATGKALVGEVIDLHELWAPHQLYVLHGTLLGVH